MTMDAAAVNGGKAYPRKGDRAVVRQDIYLSEPGAESTTELTQYIPASIVLTGDITAPAGSIWVWAESQYRFKQLMPFAVAADGVEFVERDTDGNLPEGKLDAAHLKAFRNARDDETTENGTDTYLFGTIEGELENKGIIYWTGSTGARKVILRKVNSDYASVANLKFNVYRGNSDSFYQPKGAENPLSNLPASRTGVFWIGTLPNGTYIIEEDTAPKRYFYIIVDDTGIYDNLYQNAAGEEVYKVGGFETKVQAQMAAKTKYDAVKAAKKAETP